MTSGRSFWPDRRTIGPSNSGARGHVGQFRLCPEAEAIQAPTSRSAGILGGHIYRRASNAALSLRLTMAGQPQAQCSGSNKIR